VKASLNVPNTRFNPSQATVSESNIIIMIGHQRYYNGNVMPCVCQIQCCYRGQLGDPTLVISRYNYTDVQCFFMSLISNVYFKRNVYLLVILDNQESESTSPSAYFSLKSLGSNSVLSTKLKRSVLDILTAASFGKLCRFVYTKASECGSNWSH